MGLATTAKNKFITMLDSFAPSPQFDTVYNTHSVADLDIPSLSVEVETIIQLVGDSAIAQQELIDNWNIRLSVRVHTSFRLGPVDTETSAAIMDDIVRWIREHINLIDVLPNLGEQYYIFDVSAAAYNVEHESSGTIGSELIVDIHKVENYEQD